MHRIDSRGLLDPYLLDDGYSDLRNAADRERRLLEISIQAARSNLVEWFSYEISMLVHLIADETGVSSAARELGLPREMRREIERDARKMAKQRHSIGNALSKYLCDLPAKSQSKAFGRTLSDTAKALLGEAAKLMSIDPVCAHFFKGFVSNLETLAPVFRMMDGKDVKALDEFISSKAGKGSETPEEVAASVHRRLAVLLTAFWKSSASLSQSRDELASKVHALTSESSKTEALGKEVQRITRLLRESEARTERSATDASQSSARNGELRNQIAELNRQIVELKAIPSVLPESANASFGVSPVHMGDTFADGSKTAAEAASKGDETLLTYAESLEGDLALLRGQNESNARLISDQASYVRMLEERLADARRENDKVRDSLHFMAKVERDLEGASSDDFIRYLALSDASVETKDAAAALIVSFFDRFLQGTTKGASSGMNVNGGESGTACGKYSNNLLNPVFNYLKTSARTTHPQRFLDRMCQVEWGALLDEYSGGEATAMGNKKERVVTGVRHLFRNADSQKRLPLFSAVGYLADMLAEYDVGNADLWRLADNMRAAVHEDPAKRHLKELVVSIIPVRQNDAAE